jgi:glyoxylase-like metal-dependent hydrolase (beta-lactamase superfamily II)
MSSTTIHTIMEGRFALDGGAMFGVVPKPLWSRTNPADEVNRIELGARCMLIKHPADGNILVDTGIGHKLDEKGRRIFKVRHEDDLGSGRELGIEAGLRSHGLALSDIDHVVLTHLHFDHAGGLTRFVDGQLVPTFPGRPHYVMREHWAWANRPSERDSGSFKPEDFRVFEEDPDAAPLVLLDGLCEPFEGVTLIPRHGHTPSMSCVLVEAQSETYLYLADLIPTSGHVKIPYVMGYDLNPLVTCREKRELLSEAARHGWILVFEHDPHRATARVEADGRGAWRCVPAD